jgi:hypothetical protein
MLHVIMNSLLVYSRDDQTSRSVACSFGPADLCVEIEGL